MRSLTLLKIRWYGYVLKKTVYESYMSLLLFFSIFVFGIFNPLLLSQPITAILENNISFLSAIVYFICLNFLFIILFISQRKIIFNQEFDRYVKTLPISKSNHQISSLFVLLVSNNILWILLLMGSYVALHDESKWIIIFETVYLVISLVTLQLFLYEKNISKLIYLITCDFIFITTKYYISEEIFKLFFMFVSSVAIIILIFSNLKSFSFRIGGPRFKLKLLFGSILPIQLAMLKPFYGSLLFKVALSFSLQIIVILATKHITENPNLIYFILFLDYMTLCFMSSLSCKLAIETKTMSSYFKTLPASKYYWLMKNQIFNMISTSIILFPSLSFALAQSVISISMILFIVLAMMIINFVVYSINIKPLRNTTILMYLVACSLYVFNLQI